MAPIAERTKNDTKSKLCLILIVRVAILYQLAVRRLPIPVFFVLKKASLFKRCFNQHQPIGAYWIFVSISGKSSSNSANLFQINVIVSKNSFEDLSEFKLPNAFNQSSSSK